MSNPAISLGGVSDFWTMDEANRFTPQGAAIKTLALLAILAAMFAYVWHVATAGYAEAFVADAAGKLPDSIEISSAAIGYTLAGVFGGFVMAMIIIFNPRLAPILSPAYAALEGMALGGLSAGFEAKYPGIVLEACCSTGGVTLIMGLCYASGLLRPTQGFVVGLIAAMGGILVLYFVDFGLGFAGGHLAILHDNSWKGIALQVGIVLVAALNLIIDFGEVSDCSTNRAPKYMEWYCAFSIMVTLVWLYLEVLRLIAKAKSNDD